MENKNSAYPSHEYLALFFLLSNHFFDWVTMAAIQLKRTEADSKERTLHRFLALVHHTHDNYYGAGMEFSMKFHTTWEYHLFCTSVEGSVVPFLVNSSGVHLIEEAIVYASGGDDPIFTANLIACYGYLLFEYQGNYEEVIYLCSSFWPNRRLLCFKEQLNWQRK